MSDGRPQRRIQCCKTEPIISSTRALPIGRCTMDPRLGASDQVPSRTCQSAACPAVLILCPKPETEEFGVCTRGRVANSTDWYPLWASALAAIVPMGGPYGYVMQLDDRPLCVLDLFGARTVLSFHFHSSHWLVLHLGVQRVK